MVREVVKKDLDARGNAYMALGSEDANRIICFRKDI